MSQHVWTLNTDATIAHRHTPYTTCEYVRLCSLSLFHFFRFLAFISLSTKTNWNGELTKFLQSETKHKINEITHIHSAHLHIYILVIWCDQNFFFDDVLSHALKCTIDRFKAPLLITSYSFVQLRIRGNPFRNTTKFYENKCERRKKSVLSF